MDVAEFHRVALRLLDQLSDRLPAQDLELCRELEWAGEEGFLVETLAAVLFEEGIALPIEQRDQLSYLFGQLPDSLRLPDGIGSKEELVASLKRRVREPEGANLAI